MLNIIKKTYLTINLMAFIYLGISFIEIVCNSLNSIDISKYNAWVLIAKLFN